MQKFCMKGLLFRKILAMSSLKREARLMGRSVMVNVRNIQNCKIIDEFPTDGEVNRSSLLCRAN